MLCGGRSVNQDRKVRVQQMSDQGQSQVSQATGPVTAALITWGLVRVPLVLLIFYLFRETISTLPIFDDGVAITLRVIDLFSVPVSRILLCLALAGILGILIIISQRLQTKHGYGLLVGATALLTFTLFALTGTSLKHAIIPVLLAATNFLPEALLQRRTGTRTMVVAVGLTEALILRRHLSWLAGLAGIQGAMLRRINLAGWVLTALLISASMTLLMKGGRLVPIEQTLRMPESASVMILDDMNGLAVDIEQRRLFATGHGLEHVHEFDLENSGTAPRVSSVDTGGAQGIAYTPDTQELSLFNHQTKQILFVDSRTLDLKRAVNASNLASGDPWIAVDPISDTIALVSEADLADGAAFLLLDRSSGETLDTRDIDAGNLYKHPARPWLYMSFFRRTPEIMIYDMAQREIILTAPAPARVDRMTLIEAKGELLVTSPVTSEILRFDAVTLELRGRLKAPFGVRTLAYDPVQEILFAGSFVTGQIRVIDMRTSRPLGTTYLGPWLRSIELDTSSATAYVSSNGALYRWTYDKYR